MELDDIIWELFQVKKKNLKKKDWFLGWIILQP